MKNPNGYGSVSRLSGKRRKPFVVRKTVGWNEKGHPVYQVIGYYAKREEALIELALYNKDPWEIDYNLTFGGLYEKWEQIKAPRLGEKTKSGVKSAYNAHGVKLRDMKYSAIRLHHMQDILDKAEINPSSQGYIKNMFRHMDKIAHELGIPTKNYSLLIDAAQKNETNGKPFTEKQIETFWSMENDFGARIVLLLIYTGYRITELLEMKISDTNIKEGLFNGGKKTASGFNRTVPIHDRVFHIVERLAKNSNNYLIEMDGKPISYGKYVRVYWEPTIEKAHIQENHTTKDTRHTFRTRLDNAGANKKCIDLMMGHKTKDVGLRVYTHKTITDLKNALALVT